MNRLEQIEQGFLKKDVPIVNIGSTVRVHVRIKEGQKERIQIYEGVVIRKKGGSNRETFTVRKVSYGIGVERIFPLHSPFVTKVETVREGKVRRAKLYYIRERTGRAARIPEKERVYATKKKKGATTQSVLVSKVDEAPEVVTSEVDTPSES